MFRETTCSLTALIPENILQLSAANLVRLLVCVKGVTIMGDLLADYCKGGRVRTAFKNTGGKLSTLHEDYNKLQDD